MKTLQSFKSPCKISVWLRVSLRNICKYLIADIFEAGRNRFFRMWDFPSLTGGIRDFYEKWARDSGLKVGSSSNKDDDGYKNVS